MAAQYLLHITRLGKPNLHLSQRQHMPVTNLWYVERTRDFSRHFVRLALPTHTPTSRGSIRVFRIVAEDKERALAEAPKNMRR